jgi:hypothetical protein
VDEERRAVAEALARASEEELEPVDLPDDESIPCPDHDEEAEP